MHLSRNLTFCCSALVMLVALSGQAFSTTVAVGNCLPIVHFATIQLAVNSVPASSVIKVCPGTYPEQIQINKKLTIQGVASGNNDAAVITVPAGGLIQNATSLTSGNPIDAQILVQSPATGVILSNLTIDGNNNGITGCLPDPIGIYYQNASGTITRTSVLNEVLAAGLTGCQAGLGIFVQSGGGGSSAVLITFNNVENYQKNGITGNELGTAVTITGNTVIGQGPTSGAAENSIQIGFGAIGTITGNTVGSDIWAPDVITDPGDAAAGLLVYASQNVNITSNNVNNTQFGIAIAGDFTNGSADNNTITKNTISSTHIFDGIDLCGNSNTATNNIINGSDESGVHVDDSCTTAVGNTAMNNTINSACAGVLIGPNASGSSTTPNTYYSVGTLQLTGTDVCTPALSPAKKHSAARRPKPARP